MYVCMWLCGGKWNGTRNSICSTVEVAVVWHNMIGTDGMAVYVRNRAFGYRGKKEKELLWTTLKISVWVDIVIFAI